MYPHTSVAFLFHLSSSSDVCMLEITDAVPSSSRIDRGHARIGGCSSSISLASSSHVTFFPSCIMLDALFLFSLPPSSRLQWRQRRLCSSHRLLSAAVASYGGTEVLDAGMVHLQGAASVLASTWVTSVRATRTNLSGRQTESALLR